MKNNNSLRYQKRWTIHLPEKRVNKIKKILTKLEPEEPLSIAVAKVIEFAEKSYPQF